MDLEAKAGMLEAKVLALNRDEGRRVRATVSSLSNARYVLPPPRHLLERRDRHDHPRRGRAPHDRRAPGEGSWTYSLMTQKLNLSTCPRGIEVTNASFEDSGAAGLRFSQAG